MLAFNFFLYQLKHLPGLSNQRLLRLLALPELHDQWEGISGSELAALAQLRPHYRAAFLTTWKELQERQTELFLAFQKNPFFSILDSHYPALLKEIYNPPALLFYGGNLTLLKRPSLAVIGSRAASAYGLAVTRKLIPDLLKEGYTIVSGLARGIDTAAHQMTLQHQGQTIGILGAGLDVYYPQENQRLQEDLRKRHLLLSEYLPGTPPRRHHFPARNRIIAGLTQGTIIIEAKIRSGTLITAQLALESGREVFAVPGSILTEHSSGLHALIQDGAKCVQTSTDILVELAHYL